MDLFLTSALGVGMACYALWPTRDEGKFPQDPENDYEPIASLSDHDANGERSPKGETDADRADRRRQGTSSPLWVRSRLVSRRCV